MKNTVIGNLEYVTSTVSLEVREKAVDTTTEQNAAINKEDVVKKMSQQLIQKKGVLVEKMINIRNYWRRPVYLVSLTSKENK